MFKKSFKSMLAVALVLIAAVCAFTACNGKTGEPVTGVTLNETGGTLVIGSTYRLTATVAPHDATDKTVTWSSSDEGVATVADGLVTAVAEGTADITVTTVDGGFTAVYKVTVYPPVSVTGVTLNETGGMLLVGSTYQLTATIAPADATDKTVTWLSSDEGVATVADGLVTAVAEGSAEITVTTVDGGFTAVYSVITEIGGSKRTAALPLELNTPQTLVLDGNEDIYNDNRGKWYSFTPDKTSTYVIKDINSINSSYVYSFKDITGNHIGINFGGSLLDRFRAQQELSAGETYFFFVGFRPDKSDKIEFEIFETLSDKQIFSELKSADIDKYVKLLVEMIDLLNKGYIRETAAIAGLDVTKLAALLENGNIDAYDILKKLAYYGNAGAAAEIANPDLDLLINLVNNGSTSAISALKAAYPQKDAALAALISAADKGNKSAIDQLWGLALDGSSIAFSGLVNVAESGNIDAVHAVIILKEYGNAAAREAVQGLDVTAFIRQAEIGDPYVDSVLGKLVDLNNDVVFTGLADRAESGNIEAVKLLMDKAGYGNTSAQATLQGLDVTAFITQAESGDFDAVSVLEDLAKLNNVGALTGIVTLAESGNIDAVNSLINLADYGNRAAESAVHELDVAAIVILAESGDFEAVFALSVLADSDQEAAISAAAALNVDVIIALATGGSADAVKALMDLKYWNEAVKAALAGFDIAGLITLAENGSTDAVNALMEFAYKNYESALTGIVTLAENGRKDALNSLKELINRDFSAALTALVTLAESGSINALNAIVELADSRNEYAYDAIQVFNAATIISYAQSGDIDAIAVLIEIYYWGNDDAWSALKSLDETVLIAITESGIERPEGMLYTFGILGNDAAIAVLTSIAQSGNGDFLYSLLRLVDFNNTTAATAVAGLDVTVFIGLAENGNQSAVYDLIDLAYYGNESAMAALKALAEIPDVFVLKQIINGHRRVAFESMLATLDVAGTVALAENGDINVLDLLFNLANANNNAALEGIESFDITVLKTGAENGDINALERLAWLAGRENADALTFVTSFDVATLIISAKNQNDQARRVLYNLANIGNPAAVEWENNK